ncbi:unnamed protein product, partial [Soboliphyme baturini]|uniref:SAM-dependent methyltransferase n=1 Tax=Soboliphyme baturini TaxID=241478 RepID=A0A183IWF4_9BILA
LPDVTIPDHVETRKASDSSKKAHLSSLYPGSKFFGGGPRFMTVFPTGGVVFVEPFLTCCNGIALSASYVADWYLRRRCVGLRQPS